MRGNTSWRAVLVFSAVAILGLAAASANAGVVSVTGITGHDGGNWPSWYGHLTDMINGLDPTILDPGDGPTSGMDTSVDPTDPATWTWSGGYQQTWHANSVLAGAGDPGNGIPAAINNKIGWVVMDLGSVTANLDNAYLWASDSGASLPERVKDYNLYYSSGAGIDALPAMPTSKGKTGDYDFSSGDWAQIGATNTLGSTSVDDAVTNIVSLGGVSAQYVAIEILSLHGDGTRMAIAQVEITKSVTSMAWLGGIDDWSNAAKWDPGFAADVDTTIDVAGSEVTVDSAFTANRVFLGENNASGLVISAGNSLTVSETLSTGITIGASGSMTVDGTLNVTVLDTSGAVTVNSTADMSGVGTVNVSAGTVTVSDAALGDVNFNGGTLNAGGLVTIGSLNMAGGALSLGANDLKVNNTLTIATGAVDTTTMGSLDVSTADVLVQGGSLTTDEALTAGSLTYDSGTLDLGGNDLMVGSLTANDNLDLSTSTVSAATAVTVKNATLTVGHDIATETLTLDGASIVGGEATASVKYSLTNVGEYSADITGATAELVIGEDRSQDHQITLTGNNTYGGKTTINRGVLEVAPNAANLSAGQLEFYSPAWQTEPAILQTSGTFARQLGAANGLYFNEGGGFAATGEGLTVTLTRADGNTAAPLLNNYPHDRENGMGRATQWGSPTATAMVELTNDISNNYGLNVRLWDNPNSSTDIVLFSGDISNATSNSGFYRAGAGTLWLTGTNSGFTQFNVSGGNQAVLRAVDGVGLSPTALLQFSDGVFESSGTFEREIGNTAGNGVDPGKVYFGNHGGFSAYGGKLTVSLAPEGDLPGYPLTWGSPTLGFNGKNLYLGSPTADNVVELTNPIDGGNTNRYIYVSGNPDSDTDHAVLSGELTNFSNLYVRGTASPGELRIAAETTATNVYVETGAALGGNGTIFGNLIVTDTSRVAPGDGVGTLTVEGNVDLQEGSIYEWQVGQPGETDTIDITTGTLDLGDFVLKILDAGGFVAKDTDKLPVFTYSGGVTVNLGGFLDNFESDLDGTWTIGTLALDDDLAGTIYLTGLSGGTPNMLPGDADGDGDVDAADYIMIKRNFGEAVGTAGSDGDFDSDGIVDWDDLQILQTALNASGAAGTPIPEPATLLIMLVAGVPALLKRRRS